MAIKNAVSGPDAKGFGQMGRRPAQTKYTWAVPVQRVCAPQSGGDIAESIHPNGSCKLAGRGQGYVFLFNPNTSALDGEFALTEESIGLKGKGTFEVSQHYPESDRSTTAEYGNTVHWQVPGETVVVLSLSPYDG